MLPGSRVNQLKCRIACEQHRHPPRGGPCGVAHAVALPKRCTGSTCVDVATSAHRPGRSHPPSAEASDLGWQLTDDACDRESRLAPFVHRYWRPRTTTTPHPSARRTHREPTCSRARSVPVSAGPPDQAGRSALTSLRVGEARRAGPAAPSGRRSSAGPRCDRQRL